MAELLLVIIIIASLAALVVPAMDNTGEEAEMTAARATMRTLSEALTGSPDGPGYFSDMKHIPGFQRIHFKTHDLLSSTYDVISKSSYPAYDPVTKRGWRGPYLRYARGVANLNGARNGTFPAGHERRFEDDTTFAQRGFFNADGITSPYGQPIDSMDPEQPRELTVADPWGNPIVFQVPLASPEGSTVEAELFRYARLISAGPDGELTTQRNDPLAVVRGDDLVLFLNRADTYEVVP